MLPALTDYLRANWVQLMPGYSLPDDFHYLIFMGNRFNCFVFINHYSFPVMVARVALPSRSDPCESREHTNLVRLHQIAKGPVVRTIPQPLEQVVLAGHIVTLQSVVPGVHIAVRDYLHSKSLDRLLGILLDWLLQFQAASKTGRMSFTQEYLDRFSQMLVERSQRANLSPSVQTSLVSELRLVDELLGQELPLVCQHGDLGPRNVLLSRRALTGVVDWEYSSFDQLPFQDAFLIPILWFKDLQMAERGGPGISFVEEYVEAAAAFSQATRCAKAIGTFIERVMRFYDLPLSTRYVLLQWTLYECIPDDNLWRILVDVLTGLKLKNALIFS